MKIKINEKIICISPYISTTWDQIAFMQTKVVAEASVERVVLLLHLANGHLVEIPSLDPAIIDIAFAAHAKYLETGASATPKEKKEEKGNPILQQLAGLSPDQILGSVRFGVSGLPGGMEGLDQALQHNSAQAHAAPLPQEVLEKLNGIAKVVMNGDMNAFPKPEPHCNCPHCQIARAIHFGTSHQETEGEEVNDDDLRFRDWEIKQIGDKFYKVTNPLDLDEQYNVYLGTPIGCTCGQEHCEHVRAVLAS